MCDAEELFRLDRARQAYNTNYGLEWNRRSAGSNLGPSTPCQFCPQPDSHRQAGRIPRFLQSNVAPGGDRWRICRAGSGPRSSIPKMSKESWKNGVRLWPAVNPSCMKRAFSAKTANTGGCCTTKWPCATGAAQIVKWYGSSIDIEDRKRAENIYADPSFISPKGRGLRTWVAGPSILPDSTTGPRNYFRCTVSIRLTRRLPCGNTRTVSTHGIASPWRTS